MTASRTLRMETGGWIATAIVGAFALIQAVWHTFTKRVDYREQEATQLRMHLASRVEKLEAKLEAQDTRINELEHSLIQSESEAAKLRHENSILKLERDQLLIEKTERGARIIDLEVSHAKSEARIRELEKKSE